MRKIVILFAVLMLMTPVLAVENRQVDLTPLVRQCAHHGYQYNTSYFLMTYNGTLMCAVDFPEKHVWWLFPLHNELPRPFLSWLDFNETSQR